MSTQSPGFETVKNNEWSERSLQIPDLTEHLKAAREDAGAATCTFAQLAAANTAIRATVDALVATSAREELLDQLMISINHHLGVPASSLWMLQETVGTLYVACVNGTIKKDPEIGGLKIVTPFPPEVISEKHYLRPHSCHKSAFDETMRGWMQAIGVVSTLLIPLRIAGHVSALIIVYKADATPFCASQIDLALALAQKGALAIHSAGLADQANYELMIRENNRAASERLAELARANQALRHTVDSLIDFASTDAFLGSFLQTISEVLETPYACFFTIQDGAAVLRLTLADGQVVKGYESGHPFAQKRALYNKHLFCDQFGTFHPEPVFLPIQDSRLGFIGDEREHEIARGTQGFVFAPTTVQGKTIAFIGARISAGKPLPTRTQLEVISALANQSALALKMSALADSARQAAIAQEREKAALDQLTDLARANAALRTSLDQIAHATGISSLRPIILSSLIDIFRAVGGVLWRYDDQDESMTLDLQYIDGELKTRLPGERIPKHKCPIAALKPGDDRRKQFLVPRMIDADVSGPSAFLFDGNEALVSPGIETLLVVPLAAAGRRLGLIALTFRGKRTLSSSEKELVAALGSQASLALETMRLAEVAKQEAISKEQFRATVEERTRIAGEMHDTLLQGFTGVAMQLRAVAKTLQGSNPEVEAQLADLYDQSTTAIREARRAVGDLRAIGRGDSGFVSSLRQWIDAEQSRRSDVVIELRAQSVSRFMTEQIREGLFRVGREALRNALQHSRASSVVVELSFSAECVYLTVTDNGIGFDPSRSSEEMSHWGLIGIRERVERLGGSCTIEAVPGAGARVHVEVPC